MGNGEEEKRKTDLGWRFRVEYKLNFVIAATVPFHERDLTNLKYADISKSAREKRHTVYYNQSYYNILKRIQTNEPKLKLRRKTSISKKIQKKHSILIYKMYGALENVLVHTYTRRVLIHCAGSSQWQSTAFAFVAQAGRKEK